MKKLKKLYIDHPIITPIITVIIMMGLLHLLRMIPFSYEATYVFAEFVVAVIITILIIMINGEAKLLSSVKGLGYAFKLAWLPLLLSVALAALMIAGSLRTGKVMNSNPLLIVLGAIILAICVGFFEEGLFRGIVLNSFLSKFGGSFKGILMSCIYSSIIFGFIHVYNDFFGLFTNPSTASIYTVAQILEKTIQAGLIGFILAVIFIRTHNLLDVAIIHGLNDLGPFLLTFLFNEGQLTHYVSTNPTQGLLATIGYALQILFMLPALIYAYKQLKNVSIPQWGMFKESWFPLTVKKNQTKL